MIKLLTTLTTLVILLTVTTCHGATHYFGDSTCPKKGQYYLEGESINHCEHGQSIQATLETVLKADIKESDTVVLHVGTAPGNIAKKIKGGYHPVEFREGLKSVIITYQKILEYLKIKGVKRVIVVLPAPLAFYKHEVPAEAKRRKDRINDIREGIIELVKLYKVELIDTGILAKYESNYADEKYKVHLSNKAYKIIKGIIRGKYNEIEKLRGGKL